MKLGIITYTLLEEESFNTFERVAFGSFIAVIILFLIMSIWSYLLVALDNTESGGPVGYIMGWAIAFLKYI